MGVRLGLDRGACRSPAAGVQLAKHAGPRNQPGVDPSPHRGAKAHARDVNQTMAGGSVACLHRRRRIAGRQADRSSWGRDRTLRRPFATRPPCSGRGLSGFGTTRWMPRRSPINFATCRPTGCVRCACCRCRPNFAPRPWARCWIPPYLTEPYFQTVRAAVAESQRLGMHYWLYDEGGWPSGSACGRVTQRNPKAGVKVLRCDEVHPAARQALCGPRRRRVRCRLQPRRMACLTAPARRSMFPEAAEGPPVQRSGRRIRGRALRRRDPNLPGTHARAVQAARGRVLRQDDPVHVHRRAGGRRRGPFRSLAWTDDFAEFFAARKGYDLLPWLPKLLKPESMPAGDARRRAGKDAGVPGLLRHPGDTLQGAVPGDDPQVVRGQRPAIVRTPQRRGRAGGQRRVRLRAHPPRDCVGWTCPAPTSSGGNSFPVCAAIRSPSTPRRWPGRRGSRYVVTESFCVYGDGITPAQMRWVTDHQYVRGTNLTIAGCYPLSTHDHLMPGERPHFCPANPLWRYLDIFHAYTARLGYLLTRGRRSVRPRCTTTCGAFGPAAATGRRAIRLHEGLAEAMLSRQREFDFIDDDVLGRPRRPRGARHSWPSARCATTRCWCRSRRGWSRRAAAWPGRVRPKRRHGDLPSRGCRNATAVRRACWTLAGVAGEARRVGNPRRPGADRGGAPGEGGRASLPRWSGWIPACADIRVCKQAWDKMALYFLTNQADLCLHARAFRGSRRTRAPGRRQRRRWLRQAKRRNRRRRFASMRSRS